MRYFQNNRVIYVFMRIYSRDYGNFYIDHNYEMKIETMLLFKTSSYHIYVWFINFYFYRCFIFKLL